MSSGADSSFSTCSTPIDLGKRLDCLGVLIMSMGLLTISSRRSNQRWNERSVAILRALLAGA